MGDVADGKSKTLTTLVMTGLVSGVFRHGVHPHILKIASETFWHYSWQLVAHADGSACNSFLRDDPVYPRAIQADVCNDLSPFARAVGILCLRRLLHVS